MWCRKILLAYDGSPASKNALKLAIDIAKQDESVEIVAAHILKIYGGLAGAAQDGIILQAEALAESLEYELSCIPNKTHVELLRGSSPADLLLSYAHDNDCDLIVMGSRGIGGAKGYLGSVSYAIVQRSERCAVLIAKEGMHA